MKKKITTITLLALVGGIWGTVIYRVIAAYSGESEEVAVNTTIPEPKVVLNDYRLKPDTSSLKLNYRDPFGISSTKTKDTFQKQLRKHADGIVIQKPSSIKPAFDWSFIKYSGFISQSNGKVISVMTVGGKTVMLTEGEAAESVKILKNYRDSVKIDYLHHIKIISKTS